MPTTTGISFEVTKQNLPQTIRLTVQAFVEVHAFCIQGLRERPCGRYIQWIYLSSHLRQRSCVICLVAAIVALITHVGFFSIFVAVDETVLVLASSGRTRLCITDCLIIHHRA